MRYFRPPIRTAADLPSDWNGTRVPNVRITVNRSEVTGN